jgi:O-acetylserine/cysteine efflux transporter
MTEAGVASRATAGRALAIPRAGLIQLGLSVMLMSSVWPFTRYAVQLGAAPLWFALGRAGFSGLTAFVLVALCGRLKRPGRADMPALLSVGLLQLAAFFALAHAAVAWLPAGRTAILSNVTTIFIAPLSVLVLREAISPRRWLAAGLGVVGVVVLMGPWAIDWAQPGVLVGHVFLLGAAACFAVAITVVRVRPPHLSMLQLLPWCFALSTPCLLLLASLHGGPGVWGRPAIGAMAYIGLVAGPIGTWAVMEASATLPVMVTSVGFLATPAMGLLLATVWLHEKLGPDLLLGSALILGGVAFAAWPARR